MKPQLASRPSFDTRTLSRRTTSARSGGPRGRKSLGSRALAAVALAAALAAVVIVVKTNGRSAPRGHSQLPAVTHHAVARHSPAPKPKPPAPRYWTIHAGESFGSIAAKTGIDITKLEALNPTLRPTTLRVGDRVRLR